MLDIQLIRDNPEAVKDGVAKKGYDPALVDRVLELNKKRRDVLQKVEQLRSEQNKLGKEGREEGKKIKEKINKLKPALKEVKDELTKALWKLPNLPLEGVPVGDASANKFLRQWGEKPIFDFQSKDHLEIGELLDVIDVEKAAKVSGTRFAYLKGDLVLLEFALIDLVLKTAIKKDFIPLIPPVLIRPGVTESLGYWDEEGYRNYYLVGETRCPRCNHDLNVRVDTKGEYLGGEFSCLECGDKKVNQEVTEDGRLKCHNCGEGTRLPYLYLIGTAEHTIAPMHAHEIFEEEELPKRYVGFSTAFRKEVGTYGKDVRGLLRVHQFDKVELFSFCHPSKSRDEHEFLVALEEQLWQALEIPYQVFQLAAGDMSRPAASTIDIEAWMPGQNRYFEVSSASNTTDFQARRFNIRYRKKDGSLESVHMLNATGLAIGRTLVAILENYQQKDGSVVIPEVLRSYLGGMSKICTKFK